MKSARDITTAIINRLTLKADRGPVSVGLIGIGGWGASNAVSIMRSRRFAIHGVYDIQEQAARTFARRYNTKCHDQLENLLADPDIQAVCITVPNPFHKELVLLAADAGKHVFIEKPLASYPADCQKLGQYCEDKRVVLQVGHQMRRDPVFREMKRIVDSGPLGGPLFVQGVYALDRRTRNDWRRDIHACPGGSMEQLGVHLLDVLLYLFGTPLASLGWRRNSLESDEPDWCRVALTFPGKVHGTVSTSFSCSNHMHMEVFCEKGRLATNGKILSVSAKTGNSKTYRPRSISGSVSQFIEFADCIEKTKRPETSATEAEVVMTAVQSIFTPEAAPIS